MKILILDDDSLITTSLKAMLLEFSPSDSVVTFNDPLEARLYLSSSVVDLVFLDMEMPVLSGFEFLETIPYNPKVIVLSSSEAFGAKSYNYKVQDYIIKPLKKTRILNALDEVRLGVESLNKEEAKVLFLKEGQVIFKVVLSEVSYIESKSDYVIVYSAEGKEIMTLMSLKCFLSKVPEKRFVRINKSFAVNIEKIIKVQNHVVFIGEAQLSVGRSYRQAFYESLKI